jgi:hypothetical protein
LSPQRTPAGRGGLSKDARYLYPDTDDGRRARSDYRRMIEDQLALAARDRPGAKASIEVQAGARVQGGDRAGAYYTPPAVDGTRAGIFFANLRDMHEVPTFGMRTLRSTRACRPSLPDLAGAGADRASRPFERWCRSRLLAKAGRFTRNGWDRAGHLPATSRWRRRRLRDEMMRAVRSSSTPASTTSDGRASRPSPT